MVKAYLVIISPDEATIEHILAQYLTRYLITEELSSSVAGSIAPRDED
jgi:hypothetical protein